MARFEWKRHKDIFKGVGIYHITFVIHGRKPLLGWLAGDAQEARVERTELGTAIARTIEYLPVHYQGLKVIGKCVMPDHVHVLLYLYEDYGYSIKEISRGLRQAWRKDYRKAIGMDAEGVNINRQIVSAEPYKRSPQTEAPQAEAPRAEVPQIEASQPSLPPLFEAPYIRTLAHKGQLDAMIRYIHDNPRRAIMRKQNPNLFTLRRDTKVEGKASMQSDLLFSSLGNLFLLDYPDKQPIICSRSLSAEQIAAAQAAALAQAENGCITVTAAISQGEKQIARAIRGAGLPLVILLKDGFPKAGDEREKYYKPGGVYFEACAEGRLLLLEPTADTLTLPEIQTRTEQTLREKAEARHWDYQPIPVTSDRYRMMAANEIVKQLCL